MKQRITAKQLNQLSIDGLHSWRDWCNRRGAAQLGNIGQLIEYLKDKNKLPIRIYPSRVTEFNLAWNEQEELIDTLWEKIINLNTLLTSVDKEDTMDL